MRDDFVPVDMDGESGVIGVMGDLDNAAAILEKVFQDGEVSLGSSLVLISLEHEKVGIHTWWWTCPQA